MTGSPAIKHVFAGSNLRLKELLAQTNPSTTVAPSGDQDANYPKTTLIINYEPDPTAPLYQAKQHGASWKPNGPADQDSTLAKNLDRPTL